jgi:hypothetical protein
LIAAKTHAHTRNRSKQARTTNHRGKEEVPASADTYPCLLHREIASVGGSGMPQPALCSAAMRWSGAYAHLSREWNPTAVSEAGLRTDERRRRRGPGAGRRVWERRDFRGRSVGSTGERDRGSLHFRERGFSSVEGPNFSSFSLRLRWAELYQFGSVIL